MNIWPIFFKPECVCKAVEIQSSFQNLLFYFKFHKNSIFHIFQLEHPVMLKKYVVLKKFLSVIKANQEHAVTLFCAKPNISTVIDHVKSPQGS